MVEILKQSDSDVEQVAAVLSDFEKSHQDADCRVYRYNPAAIRIRIVADVFHGQTKGERHDYALQFLKELPEDVLAQISILLCLAPGESGLLDSEFLDPSQSQP